MAEKRKKRRKKRKSRLAGVDIDIPKMEKEAEKSKEVEYDKFKTKLGKKYCNYIVIGLIQFADNCSVRDLKERIRDTGGTAIIKARSFEEAFEIYYKYVCINWKGGIHSLLDLGLGRIGDFKPRFIHKENNKAWYYDITTYIQKLKMNKEIKEHTVSIIDTQIWFKSDRKLLPEKKALSLMELKKKLEEEKRIEDNKPKRKRRKSNRKGKE